jgi:RNA polymerase sigma-70 factor (ECF subfamily)
VNPMNASATDTDELLRRTQAGDDHARDQLLQRHRKRLRRMVEIRMDPRLARRLDASDVVQEALIEASRKLDQYARDQPLPFYAWLRQLTWNRLVDLHRHHLAQKRDVTQELDWHLSDHSVHDLAQRLVSDSSTPSGELRRAELGQRVRATLARMKPNDREILVLRHLEELSTSEIAAVVGISELAAKKRQARALLRLREQLNDTTGS